MPRICRPPKRGCRSAFRKPTSGGWAASAAGVARSLDELELRSHDAHALAFAHEWLIALLHHARAAIVHLERDLPALALVALRSRGVLRSAVGADHHETTILPVHDERRARFVHATARNAGAVRHGAERRPFLLLCDGLDGDDDATVVARLLCRRARRKGARESEPEDVRSRAHVSRVIR